MIPLKNVPKEVKGITEVPRYLYVLHAVQANFFDGPRPLLLPRRFDPAFLRYEGDVPVYCTTLLVEIIQHEVAGITESEALTDLYLLIDTFPEGRRPLTD